MSNEGENYRTTPIFNSTWFRHENGSWSDEGVAGRFVGRDHVYVGGIPGGVGYLQLAGSNEFCL